jgi:hypothetical protein
MTSTFSRILVLPVFVLFFFPFPGAQIGDRFDSDPKKLRYEAAVAMQTATFLELITPIFPAWFLPIASISNIGGLLIYCESAALGSLHLFFFMIKRTPTPSLTPCCSLYTSGGGKKKRCTGKNVSWLAISSTRAHMHKTFALRDNLGDITGKAGSQSTAGAVIGTFVAPFRFLG